MCSMLKGIVQVITNIILSSQEAHDIEGLLDSIFAGRQCIETEPFLLEASIYAQELPSRIRRLFYSFKLKEFPLGICVKNNPIDHCQLAKMPSRIPSREEKGFATREEVLHFLYASLLGEVFTWSAVQNGNFINELVSREDNEEQSLSSGSPDALDLHTEDAFHPYMGDYLGFMCLKNPHRTPTIISSLEGITLDRDIKRTLSEPRFLMGVNIACNVAKVMQRGPIFFGHMDRPYMRLYVNIANEGLEADREAKHAVEALLCALRSNAFPIILDSGDCFYLDNFRAVHGQESCSTKHNENGRWLKRVSVTSYLRKSADLRKSPESRVIF